MTTRNREKTNRKWIHIRLEEKDFQEICGRYHYKDTDLVLLKEIYEAFLQDKPVAAWVRTGYGEENHAAALMTLGKEPDELQNRWMEEGRLTEAYMLECLAMAVLERAYGQMDVLLQKENGLWCVKYHFPGGEDMAQVADIVESMEQDEVQCSEAYVLIPKKSVAYVAILGQEADAYMGKEDCASKVCAVCEKKDCPNRVKHAVAEKEEHLAEESKKVHGRWLLV